MAREAKGNFASYSLGDVNSYPSDEEAAMQAIDDMFSMCGNAGQEAILGEVLDRFYEWALEILEDEVSTRGSTFQEFKEMVITDWYEGRLDKWEGNTDLIWSEGWVQIAEQSGFHDARDEMGEGTGQEFG